MPLIVLDSPHGAARHYRMLLTLVLAGEAAAGLALIVTPRWFLRAFGVLADPGFGRITGLLLLIMVAALAVGRSDLTQDKLNRIGIAARVLLALALFAAGQRLMLPGACEAVAAAGLAALYRRCSAA